MSLAQGHRLIRVGINLLTAQALIAAQAPCAIAQLNGAGGEEDPFFSSDNQLLSRWMKPDEYMRLSEIKPGMEGYGLSVFQGTKPERFNVKVIGTVKKVLSGRDAILVRLSGAKIGKCNVIRGMSGSPVYINNKLIGAISYGFDFSAEPIAGITPIAEMLDALNRQDSERQAPARISSTAPWPMPADAAQSVACAGDTIANRSGSAPHMIPLMAPVSLSGFSPRAEQFLGDKFKEQGLWASSGAGGGMDPSLAPALHAKASNKEIMPPGAAVSVLLTTGDFVTSACGTATTTIGQHVLAFGHPFITGGSVEFPMATAYIHQVLPSLSASFKLASPMRVVGSFLSDRPWSISGQLGKSAALIPATYTITDETRHIKRLFHCGIIDHPDLTPELLAATAMSAIDTTHQASGRYILKVKSAIEASNVGKIERTDRFSSDAFNSEAHKIPLAGDPVAAFLMSTTAKIIDNDFEQAQIKSIALDIALEDGHNSAQIERIFVDKPLLAPGDQLTVHCLLRPYNQARVIKDLHLTIPRDVPDGPLLVGVAAGDDIDFVRKRLGIVDPPPESLGQIARKIRESGSGDNLTAVMALPEQSILVGGELLRNPPAHWTKLFFSDRYTRGPALVRSELRASERQDYLLEGSHLITVEVRRPEKATVRSAPYLASAPTSFTSGDRLFMTESARKAADALRRSDNKDAAAAVSDRKAESAGSGTDSSPTGSKKGYPHMRSLLVWRQESNADATAGKHDPAGATDGIAIDSWGRLTPAFQNVAKRELSGEPRLWSSAFAGGQFWFGASDKIYRWKGDASSPVEVAAQIKGVAIPAMAADSLGSIFAACAPGGKVFKINSTSDGKAQPQEIATLPEQIITSLCVDDEDNLYAGVVGSGKVYKFSPGDGGKSKPATVFFDSGQASVSSLSYCSFDKRLLVGTAEKGAVYSIDKAGRSKAEYQTPDHIVTGCVRDSKGDLYVATAAQGHLIKLSASGNLINLAGSEAFYSLYYDRTSDQVFSGDAEGDITQLKEDPLTHQPFFLAVCHTEQEAVPTLCSDGKGRLFCGTANLGVARTFAMKPATNASYTSVAHDGERTCHWSRLRAYGAYNEVNEQVSSKLSVETRSGETSHPDSTWSPWQQATPVTDAYAIKSPPGRYLQYRLTWSGTGQANASKNPATPLTVGKIEVTYQPTNSPPKFNSISLRSGTACSGKEEVSVSACDSDGDNLSLAIEVSADAGKTWSCIVSDLRTKHERAWGKQAQQEKSSNEPGQTTETVKQGQAELPAPTTTPLSPCPQDRTVLTPEDNSQPTAKDKTLQKRSTPPTAGLSQASHRPTHDVAPLEESKLKEPDSGKEDKDRFDKDKDKDKDKEEKRDDTDSTKAEGGADAVKGHHLLPTDQLQPPSGDALNGPEKITWNWDTTGLKDGSYLVKFIIDDRPSNPLDHLQTIAVRSVEIENARPEITSLKLKYGKDRRAVLLVTVHDSDTPLVNASYRFDNGEPFALGIIDNISAGLDAQLEARDISIPPGSHKLEVQVTNKAGNTATKSVSAL